MVVNCCINIHLFVIIILDVAMFTCDSSQAMYYSRHEIRYVFSCSAARISTVVRRSSAVPMRYPSGWPAPAAAHPKLTSGGGFVEMLSGARDWQAKGGMLAF